MGCYYLTVAQLKQMLLQGYKFRKKFVGYPPPPAAPPNACEVYCRGTADEDCNGPSFLPEDRVLLWTNNCDAALLGLNAVKTVYANMGVTADTPFTWTSTLSDYGLIIWLMAESDPPWWGLINSASWSGRIHISGEYGPLWSVTNAYVNSKSYLHGMTLANNLSPSGGCNSEDYAPEAHPLATGVPFLKGAAGSSVSGGTDVFTDTGLGLPIIQSNVNAGIDWVVSGDSSHLADHCPTAAALNTRFLCNLWREAVP